MTKSDENIITKFNSKFSMALIGLLVFIFSFLIYLPSLNNSFVWDDVINIQNEYYKFQNTNIRSLIIPKNLERKKNSYYRPVFHFSIVFDYKNWGNNPLGYHLSNNLFFSLSSVLFFFLILLILKEFHIYGKEFIACIATIIYMVHPMHVESVSWIAGRTDILCTIFFLSAFLTHIYSYKYLWLIPFTFLFFILSFLSKEIAVAFPFLMISYDILKSRKPTLKNVYISIFYFIFLILLLLIRNRAYNSFPQISPLKIGKGLEGKIELFDYLKSIQIILNSYLYYFYKLLLPVKFNALISDVPKNIFYSFFSLIVFIGLIFSSFFSYRKKTGLKALAIIWLILSLSPSVLISVIKLSTTPIAERYLFLPICGFSLLIAYLIFPYLNNKSYKKYVIVVLLVLFSTLLFINIKRQSVWKDRITFWTDISNKTTNNAVPHINLGMALIEKGNLDKGIITLKKSFNPGLTAPPIFRSIAANNLGIAYLGKKQINTAKEWFLKGIEYESNFHKSYYHLGLVEFTIAKSKGSYESYGKAEEYLLKAVKINKKYGRAYLMLAKVNLEYSNYIKARKYAQKAIDSGLTY
ncbi:MAG: hypothetical protein GTO02_12135 [Candidatus Dadabacteria bacterium]|nr:hypothetical protein [Candidatus Dadabacteria bacterium]NIQ15102.1 hypothetical protein [Candidatus Dadabacteria bacterium]